MLSSAWTWIGAALAVLAIILLVRRTRKAQKPVLDEEEVPSHDEAPPVADAVPLGRGITMIMPRSMSAKMPRNLGRGTKHYVFAVRSLFANTFGLNAAALAEQDQVWQEWIDLKQQREPRDLIELLKSNVSDPFRARALTILLVPALRFSPFDWNSEHEDDWNYHFMGENDLSGLSEKVREYVIGLVQINADFVLESDFNEKLYETLFVCNAYTRQLLATLPEDDVRALELFRRYQLNDPIGFSGMEDSSGYNPFERLLLSPVPERWKQLADAAMRERIIAEETGVAKPRYDWERALRCYRSHIMTRLYTQNPWSVELFASQIEFLLGLDASREHDLVDNWKVLEVMNLLAGEERRSLRHRLARRLVLETVGEYSGFKVYSTETRAAALAMIEEFGGDDAELRARLQHLVDQGEQRDRENAATASARETEVSSVLQKMA